MKYDWSSGGRMPQVNLYTYLTQTTWTILLFFIFYYCMKQYLFPIIYENILLKNLSTRQTSKESTPSSRSTLTSYDSIL